MKYKMYSELNKKIKKNVHSYAINKRLGKADSDVIYTKDGYEISIVSKIEKVNKKDYNYNECEDFI